MDLKALNYFVAAYEEGNITAAAKRCHISQPSISAAISSLEDSLGIVAFTRHKRGVTPTEAGERLYSGSRRLLSDAAALESMFKPQQKTHQLTLGLMTALDVHQVITLLKPLMDQYPHLDLKITRDNEPCDGRIICQQARSDKENAVALWHEKFVIAFPEAHPLSVKKDLVLTDLVNIPLVAREYCGNELMDAAQLAGVELNVVATAFSEEWAVALVAAGFGVAIVPESYVRNEAKIVTRTFCNFDMQREVVFAFEGKKRKSDVMQWILSEWPGLINLNG